MTFMRSAAPDRRRVSTGKTKNRSPRLMCENCGAAARAPRSSRSFLKTMLSSMPLPPYRRMPPLRRTRRAVSGVISKIFETELVYSGAGVL